MLSQETLRNIAQDLPGAEEGTMYGTPAFRVGKKWFVRIHGKEDAVVVKLGSVGEQQALLAEEPDIYFITSHYEGHAAILVLGTTGESCFREIMTSAWRRVARKKDLVAKGDPVD